MCKKCENRSKLLLCWYRKILNAFRCHNSCKCITNFMNAFVLNSLPNYMVSRSVTQLSRKQSRADERLIAIRFAFLHFNSCVCQVGTEAPRALSQQTPRLDNTHACVCVCLLASTRRANCLNAIQKWAFSWNIEVSSCIIAARISLPPMQRCLRVRSSIRPVCCVF